MFVLAGFVMAHTAVGETGEISATTIERIAKIAEIEIEGAPMLAGRIVWVAEGESLAIVTAHEVLLYMVPDLEQEPKLLFESERLLSRIAFTSDFELMAVSSSVRIEGSPEAGDPQIHLVDLETGDVVADLQTDEVAIALAFGADNTRLIGVHGASYDFSVWDVQQASLLERYETNQPGWPWMLDAAFTDDASLVALGSGSTYNTRTIWNTQTGNLVVQGEYGYSSKLTFSPDNMVLAGATRYGGWTQLWRIDTLNEGPIIEYASHYILAADFSADGSLFAQILTPLTLSKGYRVQFVNSETGQEHHLLVIDEQAAIDTRGMDLIFSPDGKWLVIYNANTGIHLWGING